MRVEHVSEDPVTQISEGVIETGERLHSDEAKAARIEWGERQAEGLNTRAHVEFLGPLWSSNATKNLHEV